MHPTSLLAFAATLLVSLPLAAQPGKGNHDRDRDPPSKNGNSKHAPTKNVTPNKNHDRSAGIGNLNGKLGDTLNDKLPPKGTTTQDTTGRTTTRTDGTPKRTPTETQQQNIDKLTSDLKNLKAGSQVTPEQVSQLKSDLFAMCDNANKPSPESVQKLSKDLSSALTDKTLSNQEKAQLAKDLQSIMTSANLNPDEVQKVKTDLQQILTASGMSKDDIRTIQSDVQAIVTELQKNSPK